jgi:hypothetical protein
MTNSRIGVVDTKPMRDQIDAQAYLLSMAQQHYQPPAFKYMQPSGYQALSNGFGAAKSSMFDASGKMECAMLLLRLCHSAV